MTLPCVLWWPVKLWTISRQRLDALPEQLRDRVIYQPKFVEPKDVGELFDIADMVVAPYRAILTSGTVMAALSLARPVIAPGLPGLKRVDQRWRECDFIQSRQ